MTGPGTAPRSEDHDRTPDLITSRLGFAPGLRGSRPGGSEVSSRMEDCHASSGKMDARTTHPSDVGSRRADDRLGPGAGRLRAVLSRGAGRGPAHRRERRGQNGESRGRTPERVGQGGRGGDGQAGRRGQGHRPTLRQARPPTRMGSHPPGDRAPDGRGGEVRFHHRSRGDGRAPARDHHSRGASRPSPRDRLLPRSPQRLPERRARRSVLVRFRTLPRRADHGRGRDPRREAGGRGRGAFVLVPCPRCEARLSGHGLLRRSADRRSRSVPVRRAHPRRGGFAGNPRAVRRLGPRDQRQHAGRPGAIRPPGGPSPLGPGDRRRRQVSGPASP